MNAAKEIMSHMHFQAINRCAFGHLWILSEIIHDVSKVVTLLENYPVAKNIRF